jgi:hypothetical protein
MCWIGTWIINNKNIFRLKEKYLNLFDFVKIIPQIEDERLVVERLFLN